MFVHVRCLEMIKNNIKVTVFVPDSNTYSYIFEGILVKKMPNTTIVSQLPKFDLSYLHLLNIYLFQKKCGWSIYKHLIKNQNSFALYIHGSEVQKFNWSFQFNYSIMDIVKWLYKDFLIIHRMKKFINKTNGKPNVRFIFPSKWMKNNAEENLKLNFINFSIIPNGIDTSMFSKLNVSSKRYKIISVRSLSDKVYDIKFTIDVLKLLPKKYSLDIYGKGKFFKEYENYIQKQKLGERVKIITKFINRDKLNKLYANYGVFISTTKIDSQGVTILEAMASGLLAVSTDNSAKPEFIFDGINGVLGKTPREIADKIIKITSDIVLFNTMSHNGSLSMNRLNNHKMVQSEIEILQKLLK